MLHIRRLQGLGSHVHVNKAIGFLNTPKLSFPCCRNLPLWLVWSKHNKRIFSWPTSSMAKNLIADLVHIFFQMRPLTSMKKLALTDRFFPTKSCWFVYAVGVAIISLMWWFLLWGDTINGTKKKRKRKSYWITLKLKWVGLLPTVSIFLLFVSKGLCFLRTASLTA